jgi:hypothetical protein
MGRFVDFRVKHYQREECAGVIIGEHYCVEKFERGCWVPVRSFEFAGEAKSFLAAKRKRVHETLYGGSR